MIVYNVKRRWFPAKTDAEKYRVAQGLPPAATTKVEIVDRDGLAALLNELSEPLPKDVRPAAKRVGVTPALVDRTFFDEARDIPAFLRNSWNAITRTGEAR